MLNVGVMMTNISSPPKSQKYLLRMSCHRQPTRNVPEVTSPLSILQKGIAQQTEASAFFFPWCNRISRTQVMGELRLPRLPPPRPRYYHINFLCSSRAASRREANGKCVWNEIREQPDPCCLETKVQILKQEAKQPQSRAKYPSTFQSLLKLRTQSIGNWPGGRASGLCRSCLVFWDWVKTLPSDPLQVMNLPEMVPVHVGSRSGSQWSLSLQCPNSSFPNILMQT